MALRTAGDLLNCGKLFTRWMHGSCIPTPPVSGEDPAIFTFFTELSTNPEVSMLMHQIIYALKVQYATSYRDIFAIRRRNFSFGLSVNPLTPTVGIWVQL